MSRDAKISELVDSNPCELSKDHLPKAEDKDPEWRVTAKLTRGELEMLISDERIPQDRQVLYALGGIGGLRHGEAAVLCWRHYDADEARLTIATSYDHGKTKTGCPRFMPVHPTLAAVLAEWKLSAWPAMFGRLPGPDDLVVPLTAVPGARGRRNPRIGGMRNKNDTWKRWEG